MDWLWSLALLPLLMCAVMCIGGTVLAFFGIRRAAQPSCHDRAPAEATTVDDRAATDHALVERG